MIRKSTKTCTACYGKKQISVILDKDGEVEMQDCGRCHGTGIEARPEKCSAEIRGAKRIVASLKAVECNSIACHEGKDTDCRYCGNFLEAAEAELNNIKNQFAGENG